jgi:hypothetical protein
MGFEPTSTTTTPTTTTTTNLAYDAPPKYDEVIENNRKY